MVNVDQRGGQRVRIERSEWAKLIGAALVILSAFSYMGKTVIDDVIRSARNDPQQDILIQQNKEAIKELQVWVTTANGTLVRLTTVLENLEAKMGDDQ